MPLLENTRPEDVQPNMIQCTACGIWNDFTRRVRCWRCKTALPKHPDVEPEKLPDAPWLKAPDNNNEPSNER